MNMKKTQLIGVLLCCVAHALFGASDVTVNTAATSGGSFNGGNPNVFTPTSASAVANQTTIQTTLNAGAGVTINTASGAAGNGDLTVGATLSKSAGGTATLTLNAARDLIIGSAISASGTGALPLVLTAGRAISSTQPISTNGGGIAINTVQPFALGSSMSSGAGAILVQAGSVECSVAQTVAAGSVQVSSGAAWKQCGTINGNLTVSGTLSAGPAAGWLQVNGSLSLQSGATTVVDLAGAGQGSTYDSISASGALEFGQFLDGRRALPGPLTPVGFRLRP